MKIDENNIQGPREASKFGHGKRKNRGDRRYFVDYGDLSVKELRKARAKMLRKQRVKDARAKNFKNYYYYLYVGDQEDEAAYES